MERSLRGRALIGFFLTILCGNPLQLIAQKRTKVISADSTNNLVIAGQYNRSAMHEWLFGKHYRREWSTAVTVPSLRLDTFAGGLKPYKESGSRQTKALRMRDAQEHEYTLRTVDKTFSRALPEIYRGTFIEGLIDDQVTIAHPYAAFAIPPMADAVGIYHTVPVMGYIPRQSALGTYNNKYCNRLYMLEQRPDENWETADNFGNAPNIVSTDKMLKNILKDSKYRVDQKAYVRCRLFDMFIGDWGRHEDNWRWAELQEDGVTVYRAIPRDRDQAFSKFDGVLPKAVLTFAKLRHLQSFGYTIKDVKFYGYTSRHLDRHCADETTLAQWTAIAKDMQRALTDDVIEKSVRQMPPEVFDVSGDVIIAKLKSRRNQLVNFAQTYYRFLARHVEVTGTKKRDYFDVQRINNKETVVRIYAMNKGVKADEPYFVRTFRNDETKEVRLFGVEGPDVFNIAGKVKKGLQLRVIGTPDRDSMIDDSWVSSPGHHTHIYDNANNVFDVTDEPKLHISNDTSVFDYKYREFGYHMKGFQGMVYYDNPDRTFIGFGYRFARHRWRKDPYGFDQSVQLRYSISQNAISAIYNGTFYQALGKWNVTLNANYDAVRWTFFYGLGNDTRKITNDVSYNRLSTNEYVGSVGVNRWLGDHHFLEARAFVQGIEVNDKAGTYISETFTPRQLNNFEHNIYVGARAGYTYQNVNDLVTPTKGITGYAGAAYTSNVNVDNKGFATLNGILHFYIPLISNFSLSVRTAGTTVTGTPEFYQYASVGGPMNLRGYMRDRFWGNSAFYNTNELRYIRDVRSRIMNGKAGLFLMLDDGRVWLKGENSNTIHYSYGGGFLLSPFNRVNMSVAYAVSPENAMLQLRVNTLLKPATARGMAR